MGKVLVVNDEDELIDAVEKMEGVEKQLIRRVVVVILHDGNGKFLMHRRSKNKESYPMRWVNAASGHVEEGESYAEAAYRELKEEVGLENIKLEKVDYFFISKDMDLNGLPKFITVFLGRHNGDEIKINTHEVEEYRWLKFEEIKKAYDQNPSNFIPTVGIILRRLGEKLSLLAN